MFEIPLQDSEGNTHMIRAIGFPEPIAKIDNDLASLEAAERELNLDWGSTGRTGQMAEILIGADNVQFMPVTTRESGNLRLLRTKFGMVVAGRRG